MRDVIYDNIKLNNYVKVKNIRESLLPNINNVSLKLNNSVGARFIKQEMGIRQFDIDVEIIADSIDEKQEFIDRLAPMLFTKDERVLILDNNRKYEAILDGSTNIDNIMYDGSFTITFVAHNPIAYGEEVSVKFASNDKLFNTGNYVSRGVINLTASGNTVKLMLKDGNDYDYLEIYKLKSGDKVKVDLIEENITVNGLQHIKDTDPLGDFFDIPVGEFEFELTGASFSELVFFERWI